MEAKLCIMAAPTGVARSSVCRFRESKLTPARHMTDGSELRSDSEQNHLVLGGANPGAAQSLAVLAPGYAANHLLDKRSEADNVSFPKQGWNIPTDVSCQSQEKHEPP